MLNRKVPHHSFLMMYMSDICTKFLVCTHDNNVPAVLGELYVRLIPKKLYSRRICKHVIKELQLNSCVYLIKDVNLRSDIIMEIRYLEYFHI